MIKQVIDKGPSSEKIRDIMEGIKERNKLDEIIMDSSEREITMLNDVVTVSHGGLLALVLSNGIFLEKENDIGVMGIRLYDNYNRERELFYLDGIISFTEYVYGIDLGDSMINEHIYALNFWAKDNPRIWGNDYGMDMFDSMEHIAFGFPADDAKGYNVSAIVKHWEGVANRNIH